MTSKSLINLILFVLTCDPFIQLAIGSQSVTDRSQEDTAGPYIITNRDAATGLKDAKIRSFLWEHWHNQKRGRLTEKRYSKEGVPANTTFTIGPDEKGTWSVLAVTQWPASEGSTPEHTRVEFRSFSVRRIEPRRNASSTLVFVPDEDPRSGDTYLLVFYDENGKEIGMV